MVILDNPGFVQVVRVPEQCSKGYKLEQQNCLSTSCLSVIHAFCVSITKLLALWFKNGLIQITIIYLLSVDELFVKSHTPVGRTSNPMTVPT